TASTPVSLENLPRRPAAREKDSGKQRYPARLQALHIAALPLPRKQPGGPPHNGFSPPSESGNPAPPDALPAPDRGHRKARLSPPSAAAEQSDRSAPAAYRQSGARRVELPREARCGWVFRSASSSQSNEFSTLPG